jgi:hypothetical protein
MGRSILRRVVRSGAIALLTLVALAGPGVRTSAGGAPAHAAADSSRTVRSPGFGRLTLLACTTGARLAARAGWMGVSAGATVCVAGLWYDARARWPRPVRT